MVDRVAAFAVPFATKFLRRHVVQPLTQKVENQIFNLSRRLGASLTVHQHRISRTAPGGFPVMSRRHPISAMRRPLQHIFGGGKRSRVSGRSFPQKRFYSYNRGRLLGARRARRSRMNLPVELKFYDTKLAAASISASTDATASEYNPSTTSMISTPAVGDAEDDRDGKHIIVKSCHIIGNVSVGVGTNQVAANLPATGFVALVHDTMTSGAEVNSEDVFKNLSGVSTFNNDLHRNLLFGKRFKVLKMFRFNLLGGNMWDGTNTEMFGQSRRFEWWIPSLNMHVNFNAGTTASVANVVDNSLQMLAFTSNNTDQPLPVLDYTARIRFVG